MANEPRDHHTVPQFFLRNFAIDAKRSRIATVAKHGSRAVWAERPIRGLGYERDFYVHLERGVPVSVEADIARTVETPISQSETWAKIKSGRTDALDHSDRAILYALIRHLEARTPHFEATGRELAAMASDTDSPMQFSAEERAIYAAQRRRPAIAKAVFNAMARTTRFEAREFAGSAIIIGRAPIRLRTSTTPAIALNAPAHPGMALPLPGMVPFQRVLTLNPTTLALLVIGDFDGYFSNVAVDLVTAQGFNRSFAAHFAKFPAVRHLVTDRDQLIDDMLWAPYDLVQDTPRKIVFERRGLADARRR